VIDETLDPDLNDQEALVEKIEAGFRFADAHPDKMIDHQEAMPRPAVCSWRIDSTSGREMPWT
jgi:hypothetical protein